MATIAEILRKTSEERKLAYNAIDIYKIKIDGNEFTDYKAFSFLWEKSYVKSPERSGSGAITNLNSYASFVTPHLKIDFSLMSIDSYRKIMQLLYSKNEFVVECYDIVNNQRTTNKMYFATEEMPKLWTIARALNGEQWVELLGVQDYTVELIGTNAEYDKVSIIYYDKNGSIIDSTEHYINDEIVIGKDIIVTPIDGYNFNGEWLREGSNTIIPNKSVINVQLAATSEDNSKVIKLIAQYKSEKEYTLSLSWGLGTAVKDKNGNDISAIKFTPNETLGTALSKNSIQLQTGGILSSLPLSPNPFVTENGIEYPTHYNLGWYKGATSDFSMVNNNTVLNVNGDMLFYQVFAPYVHRVLFESNGGTEYNELSEVEYGVSVPLPKPYKSGATFKGWYLDSGLTKPFSGKMPPYNITLYAKWE